MIDRSISFESWKESLKKNLEESIELQLIANKLCKMLGSMNDRPKIVDCLDEM